MSAENERLNHLLALGRFSDAEKYARDCISRSPDWGMAHTQLGRALSGLGRHAEAVEAAREGVRKAPRDAWAIAILGYTLKHAGKLADAAEALYDAAKTDPTYTWTYCMLAEVELDRQRPREAYQATLNGVRHDPNAENLLRWKSWCEYQLEKLEDAVTTAEVGLALHPRSALLRNVVGCVRWHQAEQTQRPLRKLRLHRLAHEHLTDAVKLNPSEKVYRNNLIRNAGVCRRYVMDRLLVVAFLVPILIVTLILKNCVDPNSTPPLAAVSVFPVLIILTVGLIRLGRKVEVLRIVPLSWLGIPSPPFGEEERRKGRLYFKLLVAGYMLWLGLTIFAVLGFLGVFR